MSPPNLRLAELLGSEIDDRLRECYAALDPSAPADYRELAALLACSWQNDTPTTVGLSGGQGAGKSTLGRLIEAACAQVGLRCCVLSLDDFYRTRTERYSFAERVHPLFETRGPPGTHDMALCARSLDALRAPGDVELPVFDKGLDDRSGTRVVTGPFDVVVLEGWCIGARSVERARLDPPLNALERERDVEGTWRRAVNEALARDYEPVWDSLAARVHLQVPSLDAIRRWRLEQESSLPPEQRMQPAEVDRFIQHYERLTRAMLAESPSKADWVVYLDEQHRVADLEHRSSPRN